MAEFLTILQELHTGVAIAAAASVIFASCDLMRKKKRRVTNSNKSVRFSWSDSRVALQEQLKIRTADIDVNDDIDDGTDSDDVDIDIDSDDVDIDNDALKLTFIVASIKKCTASKKSKNLLRLRQKVSDFCEQAFWCLALRLQVVD